MKLQLIAVASSVFATATATSPSPVQPATISTCIPATLGSDYARRDQIWDYDRGRLTQPAGHFAASHCLVATSEVGNCQMPFPMHAHTNAQNQTQMLKCANAHKRSDADADA